jgi:hypothetical protein
VDLPACLSPRAIVAIVTILAGCGARSSILEPEGPDESTHGLSCSACLEDRAEMECAEEAAACEADPACAEAARCEEACPLRLEQGCANTCNPRNDLNGLVLMIQYWTCLAGPGCASCEGVCGAAPDWLCATGGTSLEP